MKKRRIVLSCIVAVVWLSGAHLAAETITDTIDLSGRGSRSKTFALDLDRYSYGVYISLESPDADLDLYINKDGEPLESRAGSTYNETMVITGFESDWFSPGRYEIEVNYAYGDFPEVDGRPLRSIPFVLHYDILSVENPVNLRLDEERRGSLKLETGMTAFYTIDVPRDSREDLRIDLFDVSQDLDLFVFSGSGSAQLWEAPYQAIGTLGRESLIIPRSAFRIGRVFVGVKTALDDIPAGYGIIASLGEEVSEVAEVPAYPPNHPTVSIEAENPLAPILGGVVEITTPSAGGSGVVVSESGYIISNFHVVEAENGLPHPEVIISFTYDPMDAPIPLYRGQVVEYLKTYDLALIKPTARYHGEPLPDDLSFNPLPIASPEPPDFGAELLIVGYPSVGGLGTRSTLTLTRGVVSGFDRYDSHRIIKTDGAISSGNSGGAAVSGNLELVGFPTVVISSGSDKLGYVYPISMIPESWMRIMALR